MQKRSTQSLFIALFFLLLIGCDNDDSPSNTNNGGNNQNTEAFSQNFGNEISRPFLGTVIDKNKNPIEGVTISIGSNSAMTNVDGVFIINNATVNERFAYIRAEKDGYIHGSRAVVPSEGTNKVTIMLLEETVVGTTSSGTSETISMGNGASVALEGDYTKDDGTSYEGNVDVIMHFLDPIDEDMQSQMPGMLYAANSNNEERMLQTFGMLAIELRGAGGEDLNLADGSEAEITVPLDPSLVANAPSTIPLWSFDEVNGYWKEEGQANLVGNSYVGTVTHFSFWNCDIPAEAVNLCITVTNESGDLISSLYTTISSSNFGTTDGSTNANGQVCGLVPSGESLELNIYSFDICGDNSIYSQSIGPFTQDSSINVIIPDTPEIIYETVFGQFNTCSGDPVTEGYVQLIYGEQSLSEAVNDGSFEFNLIRCQENNSFQIKGVDYANLQATDSINYTFTTPLTDIGTISACNTVSEFIQFTLDNDDNVLILDNIYATFTENSPNINGPSIQIQGFSDIDNNLCFYLDSRLNESPYLGTYDHYDWNDPNDTGFNLIECFFMSNENNNVIYNLNTLGEVGEYIDINFSGDYEDFLGNPHTITGIIHALRDQ
ncbi:hypothetical protein [Winogradskyella sp. 3972H.M.0a.05]|uniref:hypothetical protein n=1 Tax=Winogradskyella sp. 3972H.M.0a.05 TaxID=2950277 RepID=UPI003398780E